MRVFGIGLNKTGTSSLGKALEILGFRKHKGCDWELTRQWSENEISRILEVANENNNFEDWPWPLVYKEVFTKFPDSKFILTLRDSPDSWYKSLCKHALRTGPTEFRKRIYGYYMPHDFRDEHIQFYNEHKKQVISFFNEHAPENLLVISFSDGGNWNKLCKFLDVEIPKKRFPVVNKSNNNKFNGNVHQISISNRYIINVVNAAKGVRNAIRNMFRH